MWRPWQNSFAIFLADVGKRPRTGMRLMRFDQNGDYRPGDVVWATRQTEMSAQDGTISLTCHGRTQALATWAQEVGMSYETLYSRVIRRGWRIDSALSMASKSARSS